MLGEVKLRVVLFAVAVLFGALAWTFVKRPLPVPEEAGPALPAAMPVDGVSLSLIRGAELTAQEGFSVRGGRLSEPFITNVVAFVVEHPRGTLLIDAGVGREVEQHLETTPFLLRALAELSVRQPTIDALEARKLKPSDLEGIVLTHSHWDHVSGLADLREVPVWMTLDEMAFARSGDPGGALYRQLEATGSLNLRELAFDGEAYGPFEQSFDFFDDGSVIVVPLAGHTPGSVGVFVTDANADRVLIIGDTSWTREGVDWPAEKPWLARRMVDHDPAKVREQLVRLHQLNKANPTLQIIPAHDKRVHANIVSFE